jgi:hypothetical protein
MSSTLYVDSLIEKTSGNGVHIPGHVIQHAYIQQDTAIGTTVTMNYSSTLPTSTQGALVFSKVFTPKSTTSVIQINFQTYGNSNGVHNVIYAIFEGTVCKTAVAPRHTYASESQDAQTMMVNIPNSSLTTRTYSVRAGCQTGNGRTLYINTYPSFAGVPQTVMIIQEIAQ